MYNAMKRRCYGGGNIKIELIKNGNGQCLECGNVEEICFGDKNICIECFEKKVNDIYENIGMILKIYNLKDMDETK